MKLVVQDRISLSIDSESLSGYDRHHHLVTAVVLY